MEATPRLGGTQSLRSRRGGRPSGPTRGANDRRVGAFASCGPRQRMNACVFGHVAECEAARKRSSRSAYGVVDAPRDAAQLGFVQRNHMGGGHMQTTYWRRELALLEKLLATAEHRTYHECDADGCRDVTAGVIARRRAKAESIRRWLAEQDSLQ